MPSALSINDVGWVYERIAVVLLFLALSQYRRTCIHGFPRANALQSVDHHCHECPTLHCWSRKHCLWSLHLERLVEKVWICFELFFVSYQIKVCFLVMKNSVGDFLCTSTHNPLTLSSRHKINSFVASDHFEQ